MELSHYLENAMKAQFLFARDDQYVVKDGEIIIVDEFTGRMMPGRRYSEGLHQAIEAKEGVRVQRENVTMARITFQNYFRLYAKLAGMTGTAMTEVDEFRRIYNLDVVPIPTHRPMIRQDMSDLVFKSEDAKLKAVVEEIRELNQAGRPVLVGTVSIEKSELLSSRLVKAGVKHEVLNAKQHEREAAHHRPGRATGRRHDRHQHGRPWRRHPARRQPGRPGGRLPQEAGRRPDDGDSRSGRRRDPRSRRDLRARQRRSSSAWAGSTSWAPSATRPGASTTSFAAGLGARATPAHRASSSRSKTT